MPLKEIARELQGKAANLALRMPIAWVNILAGPPVTVDGRTLDGRAQWFLQLLARSCQRPIETKSVVETRAEIDSFLPLIAGKPLAGSVLFLHLFVGPSARLRIRLFRQHCSVSHILQPIFSFY